MAVSRTSINSPFFFSYGLIYADFFFVVIFFLIFFYEKMSRRSAETSTKRPVEKESEGSGFDPNKKQRKVYEDATEAIESAYIFLFLLKKKINIIPAKFYLIIC
jgi:hypothetical protein